MQPSLLHVARGPLITRIFRVNINAMSMLAKRAVSRLWAPLLCTLLALTLALPSSFAAQEAEGGKTWAEYRIELERYIPEKVEAARERLARLKIVTRPERVVEDFEESPALVVAIESFYDYIRGRELDVYYEQDGIPAFFPDRDQYYDFLDTMLPAMRDRKFERRRLLDYKVHRIELSGSGDSARVQMSISSDDVLPFGKIMVYEHTWEYGARGWYPGKVEAEPATYWERLR